MPAVGLGVREIRVHTGVEHRVLYVAKFDEAVYVLHAFQKRAQRTPKRDLELARQRLGGSSETTAPGKQVNGP